MDLNHLIHTNNFPSQWEYQSRNYSPHNISFFPSFVASLLFEEKYEVYKCVLSSKDFKYQATTNNLRGQVRPTMLTPTDKHLYIQNLKKLFDARKIVRYPVNIR